MDTPHPERVALVQRAPAPQPAPLPVPLDELVLRTGGYGTAPAPQPEADRRAEVMRQILQSAETAEKLKEKTSAELADLLLEHVWSHLPINSPQGDLVSEAIDRLKAPAPPAGDGVREAAERVRCHFKPLDAGVSYTPFGADVLDLLAALDAAKGGTR
jgi:hypothetical protein